MPSFYKALFIVLALSSLLSCQKEHKTEDSTSSESSKKSITLESFSEYPEEIDGCSCIFSTDSILYSQNKYIYANDFANTAFVKINGKLLRFEEVSHEKKDSINTVAKYKSGNYLMTVKVKNNGESGYESYSTSGSIEIKDNKGNTSKQPFYGICGC